jgi:aspartate kinase
MPIVMKFGGTSVADADAINNVARIVAARLDLAPIVVVSALSGVTDALLTSTLLARDVNAEVAINSLEATFLRHKTTAGKLLSPTTAASFAGEVDAAADHINSLLRRSTEHPSEEAAIQDAVVSYGELLSSRLVSLTLNEHGVKSQQVDSRTCVITNDDFTCAVPDIDETFSRTSWALTSIVESGVVPVLGGFIAATIDGRTTTLGRGGSDYTAALVGAAVRAEEIQIWTDVNGVLTADPRVVPGALTVERMSYGEAAELAYFGAKVLHPKTIQPAIEDRIPVRICNSRAPEENGTLVGPQTETTARTVKAIAHKTGVTTVQISSARMLGAYGFLRAIFEIFERHRTVVDVVTTSEVSVSLSLDDASSLPAIVEELEQLGTVGIETQRAIICVVGEGLRGTPGIAAKVFSTISDINVTLISQGASSINFTFAIEEEHVTEAVRRLHDAFFSVLPQCLRASVVL